MTITVHPAMGKESRCGLKYEVRDGHVRIAYSYRESEAQEIAAAVIESRASVGMAEKAVYWFEQLNKCAKMLEIPASEPIPSGVVTAVAQMMRERSDMIAALKMAKEFEQHCGGTHLPAKAWFTLHETINAALSNVPK